LNLDRKIQKQLSILLIRHFYFKQTANNNRLVLSPVLTILHAIFFKDSRQISNQASNQSCLTHVPYNRSQKCTHLLHRESIQDTSKRHNRRICCTMYHAHIPNLKQEVQQAKLTALRIEHFKK
jgi:hypothetical protein